MNYLHWKKETIKDFSENSINDMYDHGFVFTRLGKGIMHQTRSIRIDLQKFKLSSENRRIQKKIHGITAHIEKIPLKNYNWKLGKMAKDFYKNKFGSHIMSAQKIKEMLSDEKKSNFNLLISFSNSIDGIGHAIAYTNKSIIHYSYPFYDLETAPKDLGLGMMITAIQYAKDRGLIYIYLGSLQRPGDKYKLQFEGIEWYDGNTWKNDIEQAKKILLEEKK